MMSQMAAKSRFGDRAARRATVYKPQNIPSRNQSSLLMNSFARNSKLPTKDHFSSLHDQDSSHFTTKNM